MRAILRRVPILSFGNEAQQGVTMTDTASTWATKRLDALIANQVELKHGK